LIAVSKVGSIGPESEGVSIQAKVVGIAVEVERESSGGTARAADVCIGDETGCVMVTVTDDQIDLMVPGKSVTLQSARVRNKNQQDRRLLSLMMMMMLLLPPRLESAMRNARETLRLISLPNADTSA